MYNIIILTEGWCQLNRC